MTEGSRSARFMTSFRTRTPLLSVAELTGAVVRACRRRPDAVRVLAQAGYTDADAEPDGYGAGAGLRALLDSLKTEAHLSGFGCLSARWEIRQRLATLCRFREEEANCSEI